MTPDAPADRGTILTARMAMRPILESDAEVLAPFHADARVMSLLKHGPLDRAASDALVRDYAAGWPALGFGTWFLSAREDGRFLGIGGLWVHDAGHGIALRAAFTPEAQGQGYGPELGAAALRFGFEVVGLDRIVAITRSTNSAGQRSLEKFGMTREREIVTDRGTTILLYAKRRA